MQPGAWCVAGKYRAPAPACVFSDGLWSRPAGSPVGQAGRQAVRSGAPASEALSGRAVGGCSRRHSRPAAGRGCWVGFPPPCIYCTCVTFCIFRGRAAPCIIEAGASSSGEGGPIIIWGWETYLLVAEYRGRRRGWGCGALVMRLLFILLFLWNKWI